MPLPIEVRADTVRIPAGATLAAVDAALVRAGRWLPVDGPSDGEVGLLVTRDSAGPLAAGFGGWEELLTNLALEGPSGHQEELAGDNARLAVGSRGALGNPVWIKTRTVRRPEVALAARVSGDVPLLTPTWSYAARSATWAGWLGTESDLAAVDQSLEGGGGGVQVIRQALAEDETLRTRLWRWPEGVDGERIRLHLPPVDLRSALLEARVLAWVAEPTTGRALATVPARDVPRIIAVIGTFGGWVERVERELTPDEVKFRWGLERAERFEELRRRISRG